MEEKWIQTKILFSRFDENCFRRLITEFIKPIIEELKLNEIIENINETSTDDIKKLLEAYLDLENVALLLYGNIRRDEFEHFVFK